MANGLVRSFKTIIKYDRYQYNTTITVWSSTETYQTGDKVRYADRVWVATENNGPESEFSLAYWAAVDAGSLSGVDRTMGFYVAGVNEPGLNLPILIDGIDYPGVQVYGKNFTSDESLDAIYQGSFTDILGVGTTAINVDGGLFIDTYEGHAPEELVNGSEFDTLDFRVYTRPGSDWTFNGDRKSTRLNSSHT